MGDSQQTSTSTTGSSNPKVTETVNKLLGGLNTAYDAGPPPVFNSSLYSPAGATTQQGWQSALGAAGNPAYSDAISKAIGSFGKAAGGQDYGTNDPGYAQVRQNAIDDTQRTVNQQFNGAGRFGGGTHVGALGEGISKTISGLDYGNFQNDRAWQTGAAQLLPSLFQSSLLPSATQGQIGAAQDANQQGILQGNYDLQQRQANNKTDWLAKLSSILSGNAGTAGTTTTNTQPGTPWWSSALGLGLGAAGAFL